MTKNSLNNYGLKLLACQLLFKTMTNAVRSKADGDILSSNTTYLIKTFNSLCDLINSCSMPQPVNVKTMEQVESNLRLNSLRDFASGTLYASQVAFNLSNSQQK